MTAQAIENPLPTFTGLDGMPLQGGSVYFGQANQDPRTAPVAAYYDEALTLPVSQPVSTHSGYLYRNGAPTRIWVDGSYSVLVLDSRGRQVFYDPEWTGSDATNVLFQQAGTGAVIRTAQEKMREIVSIADFGAELDGTTSDSAAVDDCVAAVDARGGGSVFLGAGDILIGTVVAVLAHAVFLVGESHQATRIINGTTITAAIQFGDNVTTYNRNGIANVSFAQKAGVAPVAGNCGLYAAKQTNLYVENVHVFPFPAALYQGIVFEEVTQSNMIGCGVQDCLDDGIVLKNGTVDLNASGCRSDSNNGCGWVIEDCSGLYMVNCSGYGNAENAWNIRTAGTNENLFLFFVTCVGDTSGEHNWNITQLTIGLFSNCWGSTQLDDALNTNAAGFYVEGVNVSDLAFNGCVAVGNNQHGFDIVEGTTISIDTCIAGSTSLPSGTLNGKSGAGSGIHLGAGADRVVVTGGQAEGNASYGIDIDAGATSVNVDAVQLKFNTTGQARNNANGSAAEVVFRNCPGLNPLLNLVSNPAVPATTVAHVNKTGYDCDVYISGGTVTQIALNGSFLFSTTPATVCMPHGSEIAITYTVAPVWRWIAR